MPHRSLNTARMEAVAEGAAQAEREPGEGRSGDRGREASPDFFSRSPVCSGYRSRSQETRVRKVRSSSSASSWIKSLPMPSLALCCFDFLHLPLMHLRATCCHLRAPCCHLAEPATWQVQVARRASVTTRAAAHVYLPEQRYQLRFDLALTSRRVAKMGTRWTSCVVSSLAGGFRASPIPISVEVPSARHPWTFPGGFVASASRRM